MYKFHADSFVHVDQMFISLKPLIVILYNHSLNVSISIKEYKEAISVWGRIDASGR